MKQHTRFFAPTLGALLMTLIFSRPVVAQAAPTVLSVALPSRMMDIVTADAYADFEAIHPEVDVQVIYRDSFYFGDPLLDPDAYFTNLRDYVSSADVLTVVSPTFSREATIAGYVVDLMPYVAADPTFDAEDFYRSAIDAFRWDGGLWALPLQFNIEVLGYQPERFDALNLAYPSGELSFAEFARLTRNLTEFGDNGEIAKYGLEIVGSQQGLMMSLLNAEVLDTSIIPFEPNFDQSRVGQFLNEWFAFHAEGLIGPQKIVGDDTKVAYTLDETVPMRVVSLKDVMRIDSPWEGALFPGDKSAISTIQGYALSAGTQHPELSYQLLRYTLNLPEVYSTVDSNFLAVKAQNQDMESPDTQFVAQAIDNAIPPWKWYYINYIVWGEIFASTDDLTIEDGLKRAEDMVSAMQDAARAQRSTASSIVVQPQPTASPTDSTTIHFGLFVSPSSLPNRNEWADVMETITQSDQINETIELSVTTPTPQNIYETDCFYVPWSVGNLDTSRLIPLEPLIEADPDFDKSDYPDLVALGLELNGHIYGYPLTLQTFALSYDRNILDVERGWTTSEFQAYLDTIGEQTRPALGMYTFSPVYMLMLTSSFGGEIIRYEDGHLSVSVTDTVNVSAIQQAINAIKSDLVAYSSYSTLGNSATVSVAPMMLTPIQPFVLFAGQHQSLTVLPTNDPFPYVTASIGAVYISTTTLHPESCYQIAKHLSNHPELFPGGIPARRSIATSAEVVASHGENYAALYEEFHALLSHPEVRVIPIDDPRLDYVYRLIYTALDEVVFENRSVDTALSHAQEQIDYFLACTNSGNNPNATNDVFETCAREYE